MNEHRKPKVARGKRRRDVLEVALDAVATSTVCRIGDADFDRAAVRKQREVVNGLRLTEPHSLVTALLHRVEMRGLSLLHVLRVHRAGRHVVVSSARAPDHHNQNDTDHGCRPAQVGGPHVHTSMVEVYVG